jgi:hypothetical protein
VRWGTHQWKVEIKHRGKSHHLGQFDNEQEAARAFDTAARLLRPEGEAHGGKSRNGNRVRVNFPTSEEEAFAWGEQQQGMPSTHWPPLGLPPGLWGAERAPHFRPAALAMPPQPHPQNPQDSQFLQGYPATDGARANAAGNAAAASAGAAAEAALALAANAAAALGGVTAAPAPAADAATNDSATGIEGGPVGSGGGAPSCSVSVIMKQLITAVNSTRRGVAGGTSTVAVWRAAEALLREEDHQFETRPDIAEGSSGVYRDGRAKRRIRSENPDRWQNSGGKKGSTFWKGDHGGSVNLIRCSYGRNFYKQSSPPVACDDFYRDLLCLRGCFCNYDDMMTGVLREYLVEM